MSGTLRLVLALVWLAVLVAAGWLLSERLSLGGDLRKFMPARIGPWRDAVASAARAAAVSGRPMFQSRPPIGASA